MSTISEPRYEPRGGPGNGVSSDEILAEDRRWFLTYSVEFARILADAGKLIAVEEVIYFFEKPWKWTPEYQKWRRAGSPAPGDLTFEEVWL